MKFGIFSRSTAGYLMILFLLGGSNIYAILQLAQFNAVILKSHSEEVRRVDMGKRLVDSILSQRRYEQKYLLTTDPVLFNQFLAAKNDFERLFAEIEGLANSETYSDSLGKIEASHRRYQSLVDQELEDLKARRRYDGNWYKEEKEKAADVMLTELKSLEDRSRENLYSKARMVSEAGDSARRMAVLSFLMTVLLAVLLSFFITRSITKPLITLVKKTREVPGAFSCTLETSAPPEIVELSEAFTMMCDRLKNLERMKADFFAMISHELKTPLTTIREGSSLLLEGVGGKITEKQERLLTIIAAESKRLTGMVNSILDLSKMEAGMMPYTFEPQAIAPLIDQAVREITPYAEAKSIQLARQVNGDSPVCPMDGERILDVLRNLIGNAVKFTPEGGQVSIAADSFNGGLKVSVSDSGPGIPRERRTAIFEKFESSDQKKGTGLGLAIVKHIVAAHGGTVWMESNRDEGSRFIFVLPS